MASSDDPKKVLGGIRVGVEAGIVKSVDFTWVMDPLEVQKEIETRVSKMGLDYSEKFVEIANESAA